jgi:hypothetical protein
VDRDLDELLDKLIHGESFEANKTLATTRSSNSGEDRIRTCGPGYPSHRFSKPALSTTQPPLRSAIFPESYAISWRFGLRLCLLLCNRFYNRYIVRGERNGIRPLSRTNANVT